MIEPASLYWKHDSEPKFHWNSALLEKERLAAEACCVYVTDFQEGSGSLVSILCTYMCFVDVIEPSSKDKI